MASYGEGISRIECKLGKLLESMNVILKISKKQLEEIKWKKNRDNVESFLFIYGDEIINAGEKSLGEIVKMDYYDLLKRSMKKKEICLGQLTKENLRVMDRVEIGTLKSASYNLIEEDIFMIIKEEVRENPKFNYNYILTQYVSIANLKDNSEEYIRCLLEYPYDLLKEWKRYVKKRRGDNVDKYLCNMKRIIEYELRKDYI